MAAAAVGAEVLTLDEQRIEWTHTMRDPALQKVEEAKDQPSRQPTDPTVEQTP